jgi:hypothetical protein
MGWFTQVFALPRHDAEGNDEDGMGNAILTFIEKLIISSFTFATLFDTTGVECED